jgi:hypothetical protein
MRCELSWQKRSFSSVSACNQTCSQFQPGGGPGRYVRRSGSFEYLLRDGIRLSSKLLRRFRS